MRAGCGATAASDRVTRYAARVTTPWTFTTPPASARRPNVMLFVFGTGPLSTELELSMEHFGAPSPESLATCSVQTVPRGADPRWFDAWRSGSLRRIAERDLGNWIAALDAADHVHVIACEPGVVTDLTYLQGAWAHARCAVANGGAVVFDAHAMTYTPAASVQMAAPALDVRREVRVIFETESRRSDRARALHTRGLKKFGAPDLVALCSDADATLVGHAIDELADAVARGTTLALPRHAVEVAPGVRWFAVADEHHLGELLQLNNEARVLVDESGHDLVGVVSRMHAS